VNKLLSPSPDLHFEEIKSGSLQVLLRQADEPFTKFPNGVLDALIRLRLPGRQWQIVLLVIRMTFGYQREGWKTSNAEIRRILGLSRSHISEGVVELFRRNILTAPEKGSGYEITLGIQLQCELWKTFPKKGALPNPGTGVPENGNEPLPNTGTLLTRQLNICKLAAI
jgi:phage replication O-like protein O